MSGLQVVVLAGGDGERLRPLTERWLGHHTPKQYCSFVGTRSMLDHTLDRAAQLCDPSRILTIVGRPHRDVLRSRPRRASDGTFLYQPANLDTAPGVLLGLVNALHSDPDGTVVIFPSDHFVYPEWRFLRTVRAAIDAAESLDDKLILLGATPSDFEEEYGWIVPADEVGRSGTQRLFAVESFVEKPPPEQAARLFERGALWNTLVLVARVQALWDIANEQLADLMPYFTVLKAAIGTQRETTVLEEIYQTLPRVNFSSALLQRATGRTAVLPLEGVLWSDWGQPARIVESLQTIGKQPAFSLRHLAEPPLQATGSARHEDNARVASPVGPATVDAEAEAVVG